MNFIDAINDIKKIVGFEVAPVAPANPAPVAPVQLQDVQLKDGAMLNVSEMAAGGMATIEGNPAPMADYEAEDGSIIKVGEGGVITEVVAAAPVEDPAAMGQNYDAQFTAINEKFAGYEAKFADYETKITGYEERFAKAEDTIGRQQQGITQLLDIVEKLSQVPSADPAEAPKTNFSSHVANSRKQSIEELAAAMKAYKSNKK